MSDALQDHVLRGRTIRHDIKKRFQCKSFKVETKSRHSCPVLAALQRASYLRSPRRRRRNHHRLFLTSAQSGEVYFAFLRRRIFRFHCSQSPHCSQVSIMAEEQNLHSKIADSKVRITGCCVPTPIGPEFDIEKCFHFPWFAAYLKGRKKIGEFHGNALDCGLTARG